MPNVEEQIQEARQRLLDLTMRNRLLNYRSTKQKTIHVVDEVPREVYNFLVLQERTMEFRPRPEPEESENASTVSSGEAAEEEAGLTEEEEEAELWSLPDLNTQPANRHTDRFLQTTLDSEELQRHLFHISQHARSVLEEQGYTVLFLALGFLEWLESPSAQQARRAPLILIPVELERTKVRSAYKLRWTGEDVQANISLQAIVSEQGAAFPEFEMPEDGKGVDQYLQAIENAVARKAGWQVGSDIYLDFFSFTKFVMYRDLDPKAWPEGRTPAEHPLIRAILDPQAEPASGGGFSEDEVDTKLTAHEVYHIKDADPSQIAVIEDVKAGLNLVVEGPPGTGKSQTIANVIAELLAAGKSVLFVSEKMAALEVVKSRLDEVGLGDFCLELHSRKSNKREVLQELERSLLSPSPQLVVPAEKFDLVEGLKRELNGYATALRELFGKLKRSPFALFCAKESAARHFEEVGHVMLRIRFPEAAACEPSGWVEAQTRLSHLAQILPMVRPLKEHPWRGCRPGAIMPADEAEIQGLLEACVSATEKLEQALEYLRNSVGTCLAQTFGGLEGVLEAAEIVADSKIIEKGVLRNKAWDRSHVRAEDLIGQVAKFQAEREKALSKFEERALEQNLAAVLEEYRTLSVKFFRIFISRYRQLKQEIRLLYRDTPEKDRDRIVADLEQAAGCIRLQEEVRQAEVDGRAFFGSLWRREESSPEVLEEFSVWVVRFRKALREGRLAGNAVEVVSRGVQDQEIRAAIGSLRQARQDFQECWAELEKKIGLDYEAVFGKGFENIGFSALRERLDRWRDGLPKLQRWAQFVAVRKAVKESAAGPILDAVDEDRLEPEDVIPSFEGNFADDLLARVFAQRPELAGFVGEIHQKKIRQFTELDQEVIAWNRHRLVQRLHQDRPRITGGASSSSEAGILLGEINKKRRHLPIRKLMSQAGGLIQRIKPCFMMSPLSIAQFLDPRTARFDVIIFDEASQVRPEDALGALLRGGQVVVMGDTRQLPPTSFFDHIVDDEEPEEDKTTSIADVESILHQCKRSFPTKNLRWHYRSRHESLIAVSNQEFYDNDLRIYPSAIDRAEHLGLQFIHFPDAVYDRGRSSINRLEARAVAKAAMEHYKNFPDKSLGVGAFNIKQQQAILEEVELQLRRHPEVEDLFSSNRAEHFFVKNLETIQGDERDVIFLSVGYGFDAQGRLSRNFGPLNHEGGERRLNVLITRAREQCVVFSNFRAADLSLDGNAAFGLRALKVFLDYAENRNLISAEPTGEDTDSPFEDSVYGFLRGKGYEVRKQVGCAGFRVDLAIVDPEAPGRYLLGIECDGFKYHSSLVARDRDRLRQQILENLGWRIYRIWSTDWYRNRADAQRALVETVERAKLEKPTVTTQGSLLAHSIFPEVPPVRCAASEKRLEVDADVDPFEGLVPEYETCPDLTIRVIGGLHECPTEELARAVTQVVEVEGPVHVEEVVRRIRSLWGVRRTGQRIQRAVKRGIALAARSGTVRERGKFLWRPHSDEVPVRRRMDDPSPRMDLICDEEVMEAARLVLKQQFDTPLPDLVVQVSRVLGFQATREGTVEWIEKIISKMVEAGELAPLPNGMLHLVK